MPGDNPDLPPSVAVDDPLIGGTGKHVAPQTPVVIPGSTVARSDAAPDEVFAPAQTIAEKAVLVDEAQNLADEVARLREVATALARRTTRNGYVVALTATGLILDIALSIIAFILLSNQSATNNRITASIHEQCSLYALIIPSYRESARQTNQLGPAAYDNVYRRIQASADNLNCGIPHVITP